MMRKVLILIIDSNMERNTVLKLHKQFGRASSEKLLNLLKTPGMLNQETKYFLKDIYKKCAICHKYNFSRP